MLVGGAHNLISMTYFMYMRVLYRAWFCFSFKGINKQDKNKKNLLEFRMNLIV